MASAVSLIVAGSFVTVQPLDAQASAASSAVPIPPPLKVFDPSYMDTTVHACHGFFAFAQAFGCKPGDPMVRSQSVVPRIW